MWGEHLGEYLHTLTAVGVDARGCELHGLPNRGQQAVRAAIEWIRQRPPFPLLGFDSNNDSAFLNGNLTRYCMAQRIPFTLRRPCKNDQAHVEEENWSGVWKFLSKEWVRSQVCKKYDRAQTPYQRELASLGVNEESKARLKEMC